MPDSISQCFQTIYCAFKATGQVHPFLTTTAPPELFASATFSNVKTEIDNKSNDEIAGVVMTWYFPGQEPLPSVRNIVVVLWPFCWKDLTAVGLILCINFEIPTTVDNKHNDKKCVPRSYKDLLGARAHIKLNWANSVYKHFNGFLKVCLNGLLWNLSGVQRVKDPTLNTARDGVLHVLSSPTGPAEHWAGGSLAKSFNSYKHKSQVSSLQVSSLCWFKQKSVLWYFIKNRNE